MRVKKTKIAKRPKIPAKSLSDGIIDEVAGNPFSFALDRYMLRIFEVQRSYPFTRIHAIERRINELKKNKQLTENSIDLLKRRNVSKAKKSAALKHAIEAHENHQRIMGDEFETVISNGHFLVLFSALDSFTGSFLSALYSQKEGLVKCLERQFKASELFQYSTMEKVKDVLIQAEIDTFRRESFSEQFAILEKRFGVELTNFDRWPQFVECTQRRNLITHCDGIVSDQYLLKCRKAGFEIKSSIKAGDQLSIESEYFANAYLCVAEAGLRMGQDLWRKVLPEQIVDADKNLHLIQYGSLLRGEYTTALMAGEYAQSLKTYSSEQMRVIALVNYAIALKELNQKQKLNEVLSSIDWTVKCLDFRLAKAVLSGDDETALGLMLKIGKSGDYITEHAYHGWPLFRTFRKTASFNKTFKKIYGYNFIESLFES